MSAISRPAGSGPRYTVRLQAQHEHLFDVELELADPDPAGQELWMPVWIPGSYLVREFARHVLQVRARCGDRAVAVRKVAKNRWRAAPCRGALRVQLTVYARDASVRGAWLDAHRAFFNPPCLLPAVAGHETREHRVRIEPPPQSDWRVATTLPSARVDARGFGEYRAADYDTLVDHPVLIGDLLRVPFQARGTPHEVVVDRAALRRVDSARLAADLKRVCAAEIDLFEPRRRRAPFTRYSFLVMPGHGGWGGLEHADSTALICGDADLPHPGERGARSEGYRQFLGLCAHEYFHAWHVKRIRPAALTPYDLERENTTSLLWLFEGFTSYYDDLLLRRTDLLEPQQYLDLLARAVNTVQATPGRLRQSLGEASFDAWIKFYRPDENTVNATVSYYTLGSLFALALDLLLRQRGDATLDDVMRALWRRFGAADAPLRTQGVPEDALPALVREVAGVDVRAFFARHVDGCAELPLRRLLAAVGVRWSTAPADAVAALGLRLDEAQGWPVVRQVRAGSWAERAGLAAGDILLAIDGQRASVETIRRLRARAATGAAWHVHAMRDARLVECAAALPPLPPGDVRLSLAPRPAAAALARRRAWLGA